MFIHCTRGARDRRLDVRRGHVARRGQELLTYYQALFARADTLAAFAPIMGFDLDELRKQRCELVDRVSRDPELLGRAMVYLTNAGEVLSHGSTSSPHDRVFLEPQRLVDVMKELVHHDLKAQLEQIAASLRGAPTEFGFSKP